MKESVWQAKFIKYAESKGCYAVKIVVSNKYGFPDIAVFAEHGRVILFECKAHKKKASPNQSAVHTRLKNLGHLCFTCDNIKDATQIFDSLISIDKWRT